MTSHSSSPSSAAAPSPGDFVRGVEVAMRVIALIAALSLILVTTLLITAFAARIYLNAPILGATEIVGAFSVTAMLGTPVALACSRMGGARWRLLPDRGEAVLYLVFYLFIALPAIAVIGYGIADEAIFSFRIDERSYGLIALPLWPMKAVLALALLLLALQVVADLVRTIICLAGGWPERHPGIWSGGIGTPRRVGD